MKAWLFDVVVGGVVGGLVAAIVAINFVIYTGIDQGYEASLTEVFQRSPVAGVVTVMILVAGPAFGALLARRLRRSRARRGHDEAPSKSNEVIHK